MNLSIIVIIAGVLVIVGPVVFRAIHQSMKTDQIDTEIRIKLRDATYFINTSIFDMLEQQYTPEQLERVGDHVDLARTEINKKRAVQEQHEEDMMANYQKYTEAGDPFLKCRLGRELPAIWRAEKVRIYSPPHFSTAFREEFEELTVGVSKETAELAIQLSAVYHERAQAGDAVSFEKLRLLLEDFPHTLKYPADWSSLVGNFVDCPSRADYALGEAHRHDDLIRHPSASQLRLDAIGAIERDDALAAKLCLAYADNTGYGHVPLEEDLRVKLGQIVYAFNHERAQQQ